MQSSPDLARIVKAAMPVLRRHNIEAAVLFGSQAREGYAAAGDIDVAIWPMTCFSAADWDAIEDELEALPTLKKWDLCRMDRPASAQLEGAIRRDGIILSGSPWQP